MEFQVEPGQQPLKNLKRSKFLKASVIIIDKYTDKCQNNILKIIPLIASKNIHIAHKTKAKQNENKQTEQNL